VKSIADSALLSAIVVPTSVAEYPYRHVDVYRFPKYLLLTRGVKHRKRLERWSSHIPFVHLIAKSALTLPPRWEQQGTAC
jgi:hypothetical protein